MSGDARVLALLTSVTFMRNNTSGQGLAEYALILGLVAIVCLVAVRFVSLSIQGVLSHLGSSI